MGGDTVNHAWHRAEPTAFQTERNDIRCTSVASHGLETGVQTSGQLGSSISGAARSNYVLVELGAAWGPRRWRL
jgi:hypothetical protein